MVRLPLISPRKKKRKLFKVPDLRKGLGADMLDGIHNRIVDIAERAERALIKESAQNALQGTPTATFRAKFVQTVAKWVGALTGEAGKVEDQATGLGQKAAKAMIEANKADIERLAAMGPKIPRNPNLGTTVRTPKPLVEAVQNMGPTMLGTGTQLFDEIVNAIAANPPESDAARRRIAQKVLDNFQDRGITGMVDKSGRRWNMVSYVEMATRTAAGNLAMSAYLDELVKAGVDVVRVTVMPNCHPYCRPYQGRLLSITGGSKESVTGEKVVASLADALAHGFRHPNCRHTITLDIPGKAVPDPDLIDPGDYHATQQLRSLEREVRKWKRAEASAVTPESRQKARAHIRDAQGKIRDHVEKTAIPRNRWREQINHAL